MDFNMFSGTDAGADAIQPCDGIPEAKKGDGIVHRLNKSPLHKHAHTHAHVPPPAKNTYTHTHTH